MVHRSSGQSMHNLLGCSRIGSVFGEEETDAEDNLDNALEDAAKIRRDLVNRCLLTGHKKFHERAQDSQATQDRGFLIPQNRSPHN